MPKSNLCKPREDPREAELKALVAAGIARRNLNQNSLAQKAKIAPSTLSTHLRDPRSMTLGEFWDISDILKPYKTELDRIVQGRESE